MKNEFDHATGTSPESARKEAEQQENSIATPSSSSSTVIQSAITVLAVPTILAAVFRIAAAYNANSSILSLLASIALIIVVIIHAQRKALDTQTTIALGAITAGIEYFIVAVYELVVSFNTVYVFNLFAGPFIAAIEGGLVTAFLILIIRSTHTKKLKGGESHGSTQKKSGRNTTE